VKTKNFNKLTRSFFEDCKAILNAKVDEYAHRGDHLSSFKQAASLELCEPEESLKGMLTKHIVSIYQFIDELSFDASAHIPPRSLNQWHEKLVDAVNYIGPLLWALLNERYQKAQNKEPI